MTSYVYVYTCIITKGNLEFHNWIPFPLWILYKAPVPHTVLLVRYVGIYGCEKHVWLLGIAGVFGAPQSN
jgi:hypothetical protein